LVLDVDILGMKFKYQARDQEGIIQTGKIEASTRKTAINLLHKRRLYVTSLERIKKPSLSFEGLRLKFFGKVSKKDLAVFSRQLAVMIESRVSLVQSLLTLAAQTANPNFREVILDLAKSVEEGSSLSESCSLHPKLFNEFYVSLLESGETSGKISESLYYLSDHLEREYNLVSDIRSAMVYPALIFTVLMVAIIIVIVGVIPPFTDLLKESGAEVPFTTKLMLGFYGFLRNFGWVLILAFVGLIVFIIYYLRTNKGKRIYDKATITLPIIGGFLQKVFLIRFAENLATLIGAGISITEALRITRRIIGNFTYMKILREAEKRVVRGEQISSVLVEYPEVVPIFVTQMVKVGEGTGKLQKTLMEIVNFYQKEIERGVETFMSLIEPILIVFLGVIVALLVASVFMPLYSMIGTF